MICLIQVDQYNLITSLLQQCVSKCTRIQITCKQNKKLRPKVLQTKTTSNLLRANMCTFRNAQFVNFRNSSFPELRLVNFYKLYKYIYALMVSINCTT